MYQNDNSWHLYLYFHYWPCQTNIYLFQTLLDYSGSIFDWFQKKAGKKDRCWFDKANNGSTSINAMNYHFDTCCQNP
jgi:hypothetical protein